MIPFISHLFTAFGLASASGLNAYIPLLIVALAARFTGWVNLNPTVRRIDQRLGDRRADCSVGD